MASVARRAINGSSDTTPTGRLVCDRSRRPHASPHATDPELLATLNRLRQRHPRWGAEESLTVAARALHDDGLAVPVDRGRALKARGLITPRRRRSPPLVVAAVPRAPITRVNETRTTDYKGEFLTGDGRTGYPLTLRDGFSRLCSAATP